MLDEDKEAVGRESLRSFVKDEEAAGRAARETFDKLHKAILLCCDKEKRQRPEMMELLGGLAGEVYDRLPPFVRGFVGNMEIPDFVWNFVGESNGK